MSTIAKRRTLSYWFIAIFFILTGGAIYAFDTEISPAVHVFLGNLALAGAVFAACAVWVGYNSTRSTLLAIVGLTLAAVAAFDLLHALAGSEWLSQRMVSNPQQFADWTWKISRLTFAGGFFFAGLYATAGNFSAAVSAPRSRRTVVLLTAITFLVFVAFAAFAALRTELPTFDGMFVGPVSLVEACIGGMFLATLLLHVLRGNWRSDSYGHWINVALVAGVSGQLFCTAFAQNMLDPSFTAGHILKILGYAAIIYGFVRAHRTNADGQEELDGEAQGLGLGVKVGLLCGFIGAFCLLPIAVISATNLHTMSVANGTEKLAVAAANTARELEARRRRVDADLNYLSSAAQVGRFYPEAATADAGTRAASLTEMFADLLKQNPDYLGFAFYDADIGMALIRQLQESSLVGANSAVFRGAENTLGELLLSSAGASRVSRSDINVLVGADLNDAQVPVESAALAVTDVKTGKLSGVLVAHVGLADLFTAKSLQEVSTELFVVNEDGYFLVHPDPLKNLAISSGANAHRLANEFPDQAFGAAQGDFEASGFVHKVTGGEPRMVGYTRASAGIDTDETLLYIYAAPQAEMEAATVAIGYQMQRIALLNLVFAVVIGWFFARRLAKPVQQLSAAAQRYGRTGEVVPLETADRDEIGTLSKSFVAMMNEVSSQRENLMLLAAAVESSVNSTIITSTSGEIRYVNPRYETYAGLAAGNLIGTQLKSLAEFARQGDMLSKSAQLQQQADSDGDSVWVGEMRVHRADGRLHDELVTITPITDDTGRVANYSVVIEDITERRTMERRIEANTAELKRSNRDLEQFAYVASHDLKSPLRAIEVIVGWLKDDLEGHEDNDIQENLDLLGRRTTRLSRLLDDLLAYSRAGRKVGDIRTLDTRAFVEEIVDLVHPPEGFTVDVDSSLPEINTYHAPLETVFRNLIGNAIKHSPVPEEGCIRVFAEDRGDRVEFAVQDNGTGIEPQYADKVFKIFQTLKARDEQEGSGMGLAIVKRIIDWNGGDIWFHENPDGRGTVFRFTWAKEARPAPEVDVVEDPVLVAAPAANEEVPA